jgi:hypothetical protein
MTSTETHPYDGLSQPDTNNATWFNPKEKSVREYWGADDWWEVSSAFRFSKKQVWWNYLESLNQGTRNGKWTNNPYWTYRDNSDLVDNVADQIGTTAAQARRANRVYFHLHNQYITGIRKDATAVAVVVFVIEDDEGDERGLHPQSEDEHGEKVAESLAKQFSLDAALIISTYGKVQHYLRISDDPSKPSNFDLRRMDRRGLYEGPKEAEQEVYQNTPVGGGGI